METAVIGEVLDSMVMTYKDKLDAYISRVKMVQSCGANDSEVGLNVDRAINFLAQDDPFPEIYGMDAVDPPAPDISLMDTENEPQETALEPPTAGQMTGASALSGTQSFQLVAQPTSYAGPSFLNEQFPPYSTSPTLRTGSRTGSVPCQCNPHLDGDSLPIPKQRPILICNAAGSRTAGTIELSIHRFTGALVGFYLPCQLSDAGKGQYWQCVEFKVGIPADDREPRVSDIQLLPNGLIVVTDSANVSVKVFNSRNMGQFVGSQKLMNSGSPAKLALFNSFPNDVYIVAVSLTHTQGILFLEVKNDGIQMAPLNVIKTKGACQALATFLPGSLAVGYRNGKGIDLYSMEKLERQLSPNIKPTCLAAKGNGDGLVCIYGNEISKLKCNHWQNYEVPTSQIKHAGSIAVTGDGLFVADSIARTLHLVDGCGLYVGELWRHPSGNDKFDPLESLSSNGDSIACSTRKGPVYVFDLVHGV